MARVGGFTKAFPSIVAHFPVRYVTILSISLAHITNTLSQFRHSFTACDDLPTNGIFRFRVDSKTRLTPILNENYLHIYSWRGKGITDPISHSEQEYAVM